MDDGDDPQAYIEITSEQILKAIAAMIAERKTLLENAAAARHTENETDALRDRNALLQQQNSQLLAQLERCKAKNDELIEAQVERYRYQINREILDQANED